MGKRAIIYLRTAMPERPNEGESFLYRQHNACLHFCEHHEMEVVGTITEVASGNGLHDRLKLDELRQMVRDRHVDIVIVYNLGRLGRWTDDLVTLTYEVEKHSVAIVSVFELLPIDSITPLQAQAMTLERQRASAIYAQMEAHMLREQAEVTHR